MRNLKQQLHSSYYAVHFNELTLLQYYNQLNILDTIIASYDVQVQKGNLALKDLVRLKSVYLELNNNRSELQQDIEEQQKNLQILLHTEDYVSPEVVSTAWTKFTFLPSVDTLYNLSKQNRADWKLALMASGLLVVTLISTKFLGMEFLSQLNEGTLWVEAKMPMSSSLNRTVEMVSTLRKELMKFPEVNGVLSQVGALTTVQTQADFTMCRCR